MELLIGIGIIVLLLIGNIVQFIMLRGALKIEKLSGEIIHLTGREIETIRRKLSTIGMQAITIGDVFSLIMTIRETHLGNYVDDDPYIPADPYEDIDEYRRNK